MIMHPVETTFMLIQRLAGRAVHHEHHDSAKKILHGVFDAGKAGLPNPAEKAVEALKGCFLREVDARSLGGVAELVDKLHLDGVTDKTPAAAVAQSAADVARRAAATVRAISVKKRLAPKKRAA